MGIAERNLRKAEPHLEPGEEAVAASLCQTRGSLAMLAAFGALGALLTPLFNKKKRAVASAAGLQLAGGYTLLVATNRRLLSISGKKLLGSLDASAVAGAAVLKKNAVSPWRIRIDLAGGTGVELDANRLSKPDVFVEAVQQLAGAGHTPQ